jgi:hypothetical protein
MRTFRITEIAIYDVEASTEDDALQRFLDADSEQRDKRYFVELTELEINPLTNHD